MKLSPFFDDLFSSYGYEIEDLTYDSGGDNVLKSRLKVKRDQIDDLLQMTESHPVMVAPAFHGGFRFSKNDMLDQLVACMPDAFPTWESLTVCVELEPWAAALAKRALLSEGGNRFMVITAGLEYLMSRPGVHASSETPPVERDDSDDAEDLGDAGEDWLGEQGFDRRS